jgi:hypothetical protein
MSTDVFVYDVYSGKKVNTFARVAPWPGHMTISTDGRVLYVTDMTNYEIIAVDAVTGARLGRYPVGYPIDLWFRPVYARPYGKPALLAPGGPMIAVPSGEHLVEVVPYDFLSLPANGKRIYSLSNDGILSAYRIVVASGQLALKYSGNVGGVGENCQDVSVSFNGARVYTACGFPYEFHVYDGETLSRVQTLGAAAYPNNTEIAPDGNFAGGIDGMYEDHDVWVYDPVGALVGKILCYAYPSGGSHRATMKISGDGTRVIMATNAGLPQQSLKIRNMP